MKNIIIICTLVVFCFSCKKSIPDPEATIYVQHTLPSIDKTIRKISFSSGCKQYKSQAFWQNISGKESDLWIWGGDNIYSDTEDRKILQENYKKLKENEYYQAFIKNIPVIGVWDDHDYGARDSGEKYILKEESKEEFMDFFDIPTFSDMRAHKGIYTSYELGTGNKKIKIYLLDNRTFKTELTLDIENDNYYIPDSSGTILGEKQWKWLEDEINNNDSRINIFVSGLQIIPNGHIYEKWGNFPNERQRFLDLLENTKVENPIILSGDRHLAELSEYKFLDNSKVFEFTASGMTHSFENADEDNEHRIGKLYGGRNFGEVIIKWNENTTSELSFILNDINGNKISKTSYSFQ